MKKKRKTIPQTAGQKLRVQACFSFCEVNDMTRSLKMIFLNMVNMQQTVQNFVFILFPKNVSTKSSDIITKFVFQISVVCEI